MWTRLETGPVTRPHQHQSKTESEARPPRHRDDALPPTGQDQAHIGPHPTFQAGERIWYLDMQPSKLNPGRMEGAWTWPWVVVFKEAPGLYRISNYNQAAGRTTRTVHVGRLRRSTTGTQEGSAREQKGELPEDLEPEEQRDHCRRN